MSHAKAQAYEGSLIFVTISDPAVERLASAQHLFLFSYIERHGEMTDVIIGTCISLCFGIAACILGTFILMLNFAINDQILNVVTKKPSGRAFYPDR